MCWVYVADELEAARDALRRNHDDATIWAGRADAATNPDEAAHHRVAADTARAEADRLAPLVEQLDVADAARAAWLVETAVTRDRAERSRIAAGLRSIDLDNPTERVTADEWLDAEAAAREADDDHRSVGEHDLAEDAGGVRLDDAPAVDAPAVETGIDDVRERSASDPSERADPAQRRRVPLPDETAAAVERARTAVVEIADRQQAEAAAAAHAAEVEPEDEARRAELARWADDDRADEAAAETVDEDVLERGTHRAQSADVA